MDLLTLAELNKAAAEVQLIRKCTDPTILKLERHVQIIDSQTSHSFARCAGQAIQIKALMISDGIPVLWISLNLSDL